MRFLINLESAHARRARMLAQLGGIEVERIGVDGRKLSPGELDRRAADAFPGLRFDHARLSGAEVGCWLSHLLAWRALLQHPDQVACAVIEDDLRLHPRFAEITNRLIERPPCELVFLGTSSRNLAARGRLALGDGYHLHRPVGAVFNTWGYVIRRDACARLLEHLGTIAWPIDHVLGGRIRRLAPVRTVIQPALVGEDSESGRQSQIEPHTFRIDRTRWLEQTRRRMLASPVGDLYASLHRWL